MIKLSEHSIERKHMYGSVKLGTNGPIIFATFTIQPAYPGVESTRASADILVLLGNDSNMTAWWLSHPSEKYEFVNWDDDRNPIYGVIIPNIWENAKFMATSHHQPEWCLTHKEVLEVLDGQSTRGDYWNCWNCWRNLRLDEALDSF